MENWQLTLVILASVTIGALVPVVIMAAVAIYRVGTEIAAVGAHLRQTLTQVDAIAGRVEVLSRGLKGGETDVAAMVASLGHLAHGIERNLSLINIFSTIAASIVPMIVSLIRPTAEPEADASPIRVDTSGIPSDLTQPHPGRTPPASREATS
jgi:hypothetical protein